MVNDIIEEAKQNMGKAIDALRRELTKIRTGRANLALLDGIRVDYYGTPTPLNQVANLAIPDPRMITIKPWEKKMLVAIVRAIQESDIGLSPSNDSELVRLPIPVLTTERRKELIKQANRIGEEAKVAIRNARRDANESFRTFEKSGDIPEDESKKGAERTQKETDEAIKKVDEILAGKAKEIEG